MLQFNTTFTNTTSNKVDPEELYNITHNTSCFLPHFKEVYNSKLRYYDIKSGRGGAKTSQLARTIIKESFLPELYRTSFACGREFANNIEETSYNTIQLLIEDMGYNKYFNFIPSKNRIENKVNKVKIYFSGCQRPEKFTSISNLSRLWLDEIASIDRYSIERIFKSVRGSILGKNNYTTKIYCSYNPITQLDPITAYLQERIKGGMGLEVHKNIFDLPSDWQDKDLLREAEIDRANDIDLFNWIWLGKPRPDIQENLFENVIFNDLATIPTQPVIAYMDPSFIGGDTTAISFVWENNTKICCTGYCFKNAWYELDNVIMDLYSKYKITEFYYEKNMLGDSVSNHYYTRYNKILIPHQNSFNKVAKIYKLGYYLKKLEFYKPTNLQNSTQGKTSWQEQIRNYNRLISVKPKKNEHDDAPDSLASLFMAKGWFN